MERGRKRSLPCLVRRVKGKYVGFACYSWRMPTSPRCNCQMRGYERIHSFRKSDQTGELLYITRETYVLLYLYS
jgi:hypothetical protein